MTKLNCADRFAWAWHPKNKNQFFILVRTNVFIEIEILNEKETNKKSTWEWILRPPMLGEKLFHGQKFDWFPTRLS